MKNKENSTNNQNKRLLTNCDMTYAMQLIEGRWKLLILASLNKGSQRYTEIQKKISQITERMLSLQLRELEQDGIIAREVFPEVPPRVVYTLTDAGKRLIPIVLDLSAWGTSLRALHEAAAQDNG